MTTSNGRTADFPIGRIFLDRWSPRDFSGEQMDDRDLFTLFEAARWAPSSNNLQPWRFLYAKCGSSDWSLFFDLLSDGNKAWACTASVLIAVLSKRTAPIKGTDAERKSYSHSFDAGAAWGYLALQASLIGWAAHATGGFDAPRAIDDLGISDAYRIECMVAVGRPPAGSERPAARGRSPQTSFVRAGPMRAATS